MVGTTLTINTIGGVFNTIYANNGNGGVFYLANTGSSVITSVSTYYSNVRAMNGNGGWLYVGATTTTTVITLSGDGATNKNLIYDCVASSNGGAIYSVATTSTTIRLN